MPGRYKGRRSGAAAAAMLALTAVFSGAVMSTSDAKGTKLVLKQATFKDLPGWEKDRHGEAMQAFRRSCAVIENADPAARLGGKKVAGKNKDWLPACEAAAQVPDGDDAAAKKFFEDHFKPWAATESGDDDGLFTGYYEAELNGSRTKDARFKYPVHSAPSDLGSKKIKKKLKPYWDRAAILKGEWPHDDTNVIAWVDDLTALYFMHVQGSGRINMPDGTFIRVEYNGQNGHSYTPIGRELVRRGEMKLEDVTLQTIREWLKKNPDKALDIISSDKSYVFFHEVARDAGPVGAQKVVLTPQRSMAVDHTKVPYGLPIWLDVQHPEAGQEPIRRLVMGQDTGGAIRGAVRGDYFWGHGPQAEDMAGKMKSRGRYWFLLPKDVKPK